MTCSFVAFGFPMRILSKILCLKRNISWNTKLICFIKSLVPTSRTSTFPILMLPEVTSQKREIKLAIVLFPPPDKPTIAVICPWLALKDTFSIAISSFFPVYVKLTLSNTTSSFWGFLGLVVSGRTGILKISSILATFPSICINDSEIYIILFKIPAIAGTKSK